MTIGARLKEERLKIGLNQTDLAKECGISKNTQLAYEKGERSPDAEYFVKASKLGLDMLYVVFGVRQPMEAVTTEEADILRFYRALSPSDQESVHRMVFAMYIASTGNKSN